MMKPKYIPLLILACLFHLSVSAQNIDGGATKLLQDVAAQYQKYATLKFQYTLKVTQETKTLQNVQGSMTVKGNKYHVTYNDVIYLCDGASIWNYDKSVNEVSIYEYDPTDENNLLNPQRMLSDWETHFRAKYIRNEFIRNRPVIIIDLTPKVSRTYYKIRLFLDKSTRQIARIAVYDKDNTIFTYYIEQFKVNEPVADSSFVFDIAKHPGVEVNDMR